jgi:FixJ family two-component response regulator/ActR/RegA family two-component response regulator
VDLCGLLSAVRVLDPKLDEWIRHRERLEREIEVLVIDGNPKVGRELEQLLRFLRYPARSTTSVEEALDLVVRGEVQLILASDDLEAMDAPTLAQRLRVQSPDVDVLLTSEEPSLGLCAQAARLGLLDVLEKPIDKHLLLDRLPPAVAHNIDRRMQELLFADLKRRFQSLEAEARLRTTAALEQRLLAFKNLVGTFDRVLVVEGDDRNLVTLSEHLLLSSFHVELSKDAEAALLRASDGDLNLMVVRHDGGPAGLAELAAELREASPLTGLVVVAGEPDVGAAQEALRSRIPLYLVWPPASYITVVEKLLELLRTSRQSRLRANLLLELFLEVNRPEREQPAEPADLDEFKALTGLADIERLEKQFPLEGNAIRSSVDYLDGILSHLLESEGDTSLFAPTDLTGFVTRPERSTKRRYARIPESQYVRFRPKSSPSAILAVMGDLGAGGMYICTEDLQQKDAVILVEFDIAHEGKAFFIRCLARVAWVAKEATPRVPVTGFGVEFLNPPADVLVLLQTIVQARMKEQSEAAVEDAPDAPLPAETATDAPGSEKEPATPALSFELDAEKDRP